MAEPRDLRGVVARLCRCSPDEITPDFSLDTPALRGSLKKAVLIAAIRRYLGADCMGAAQAQTFSELEAMVSGQPRPAASPARNPASAAGPAAARDTSQAAWQASSAADACGIDIESIRHMPETDDYLGHEFYRQAFTPEEISYCSAQASPRVHFAARWCAKEALKKCDAALRDLQPADMEVVRSASGEPYLRLRNGGAWRRLPHLVSMAHTEDTATAVVILRPEPEAGQPADAACACLWRRHAALIVSLLALALAAAALLR